MGEETCVTHLAEVGHIDLLELDAPGAVRFGGPARGAIGARLLSWRDSVRYENFISLRQLRPDTPAAEKAPRQPRTPRSVPAITRTRTHARAPHTHTHTHTHT